MVEHCTLDRARLGKQGQSGISQMEKHGMDEKFP